MPGDNGHGWPKHTFRTPWAGWFTRRYGEKEARQMLSSAPVEGRDYEDVCDDLARPDEGSDDE